MSVGYSGLTRFDLDLLLNIYNNIESTIVSVCLPGGFSVGFVPSGSLFGQ